MENKVSMYLSSKDKNSYTQLDYLFEMYLHGMMEQELSRFHFTDIEIFATCNKGLENSIQVNFKYDHMVCTIDFSNRKYEYVVYAIGDSFDQIKDSFIECEYEKEFSFRSLLNFVHQKLKMHPNRNKDTSFIVKKKKYKLIANICLIIPCVIIGVLAIYVLATKETITLGPYSILIIVIPIILWLVFDVISARNR